MAEEKKFPTSYKVVKINTTSFSYQEIEEKILLELFSTPEKVGMNINTSLNIDVDKSNISIEIRIAMFDVEDKDTFLIKHSGLTTFYVEGLKSIHNEDKNNYDYPTAQLIQLYSLAYTHSRALLSIEISPTVYKELLFLPVIDPTILVQNLLESQKEKEKHTLTVWIEKNCKRVATLSNQLTTNQCGSLLDKYGEQKVKDKLYAMENRKDLTKKYDSVYLTLNNWLKKDNPDQPKREPSATMKEFLNES